ncbi:uncharacterized protein AMSG_06158 [Thecamonas trahens ATCC 50062]|uniref:PDZ domain-containing protein n=1 Tax=Thecamonas trahens ATCC 50062 TaxID=461836 RepID=A0A0L0DCA0_THETB|nr:hypothetical protein AMSG_06158 [Thecamonas trahens ATCC 50062]KNC49865.1 hypothetical protein AMSG_06158 [Thecamonas trahens ATCC 50062]|eukprot:XP_013757349.1 hypothetical protein AMSG_06158 [Thecamonas trahens ATCC 50062]
MFKELAGMLALFQPDDPFAFLIDGLRQFQNQAASVGVDGVVFSAHPASATATPPISAAISSRIASPSPVPRVFAADSVPSDAPTPVRDWEPRLEEYDFETGISLVYVDTNANLIASSETSARAAAPDLTFVTQAHRGADGSLTASSDYAGVGLPTGTRTAVAVAQEAARPDDQLVTLLAYDPRLRAIDSDVDALTAAGLLNQPGPFDILSFAAGTHRPADFATAPLAGPAILTIVPRGHTLLPPVLDAAAASLADALLRLTGLPVAAALHLEDVRISLAVRPQDTPGIASATLASLRALEHNSRRSQAVKLEVEAERKAREARARKLEEFERADRLAKLREGQKMVAQREALHAAARKQEELQAVIDAERAEKDAERQRLEREKHKHERWKTVLLKQKESLAAEKAAKEKALEKTMAQLSDAERVRRDTLRRRELEQAQLKAQLEARETELAAQRAAALEAQTALVKAEAALVAERRTKSELSAEAKSEHERAVAAEAAARKRVHDVQAAMMDVQGELDAADMERRQLRAQLEEERKAVELRDQAREKLLSLTSICGVGVTNSAGRTDCVAVTTLSADGPAQLAGLRVGDLILRVGEIETNERQHFMHVLHAAFVGETEIFHVERNGRKLRVPVQFGAKGCTMDEVRALRHLAGADWCRARDDGVEGITDMGKLLLAAEQSSGAKSSGSPSSNRPGLSRRRPTGRKRK